MMASYVNMYFINFNKNCKYTLAYPSVVLVMSFQIKEKS